MGTKIASLLLALLHSSFGQASQEGRTVINLNGTWDFEQTENAFPPERFTRKIPVPGLIHLAEPKVDQFDALLTGDYKPRYNWYRRGFHVPAELKNSQAVVCLLKSMYVTQVFVNGMDAGTSISCYTPVEFPVTRGIRFGEMNELLIRVGDRAWLPSAAAGGTDKEKIAYLPGIWDDVSISFTGRLRAHRVLVLPSVAEKKVTAKVLVRSFYYSQVQYGDPMEDLCRVSMTVREKISGKVIGPPVVQSLNARRDNLTPIAIDVPMNQARLWTPDAPFLYAAEVVLHDKDAVSDRVEVHFGMRDFKRQGKHFYLNGRKLILRGTNITLHRFFEDPECGALPWDRAWVKKLLADIPKGLHWNAMRICVGVAPSFWYDIADESGLLLQNEWLYWQNHGWDDQIRTEYTDWVWTDGNHPSIVIWDAINENWDPFIGNVLIPDLKKLDPTRIWDAGYMTSEHMTLDEMDEPHPYRVGSWRQDFEGYYTRNPYSLGDLDDWEETWQNNLHSSAAQLVNEYGWVWLWRDGRPAKLTEKNYAFYLGKDASPEDRWNFQAYWLQLETEWLRAERTLAGVLCFCYLTNNYGFTGDWFVGPIKELRPGPTLDWFAHCFSPAAVFIDLPDGRYTKHVAPYSPDSELTFNLVGVNDYGHPVGGEAVVKLLNSDGQQVSRQSLSVSIPAFGKQYIPARIQLPRESGGCLLVVEYAADAGEKTSPVVSRRFIKVGRQDKYSHFEWRPAPLRY